MQKILKWILFGLILASMAFVHVQYHFKPFSLEPLHGDVRQTDKPVFAFKYWFPGYYQDQAERYVNDTFGFRSTFIRINNQILFSWFRTARARGVIIGRDNYLCEENYLKAWDGEDFIGKDSILRVMKKVRYIQDTLKKLNKDILLVFAPGKGSFFSEFFPEKYLKQLKPRNHDVYVKYADSLGLNYIDFWTWFRQHKSTSKYPLYTKYGVHWSTYGKDLAFDSIVHYIEKKRYIDAPDFLWKKIDESYECREVDCDIEEGMNLLYNLPPVMHAYPDLGVNYINKVQPCVLTIADSHYWGIFGPGLAQKAFDQPLFYYYYKELLKANSPVIQKENVHLKSEIENHDVIMILATDVTLPNFGWGFIQDAYTLYGGKN